MNQKDNVRESVAAIITTYKRTEYLRDAIISAKIQTHQLEEIIVVDDNTDYELNIITKKICSEENVKYIVNNRSKGGCGARNSGILHAASEYVAFLDDDDIWLPQKIKLQLNLIRLNPNASACYCSQYGYYEEHNKITEWQPVNSTLTKLNFFQHPCPASTSLILAKRKNLIFSGLFDENLPSFQDYDMWARLVDTGEIIPLNKGLSIMRHHAGERTSVAFEKRLKGLDLFTKKWEANLSQQVDIRKFEKYFIGFMYSAHARNEKNYLRSIAYHAISFYLQPKTVKRIGMLAISLAGPNLYMRLFFFRHRVKDFKSFVRGTLGLHY